MLRQNNNKINSNEVFLPKKYKLEFIPTWNGKTIGLAYNSFESAITGLSNPEFWKEWAEWMSEYLSKEDIDSIIRECHGYKPKVYIYKFPL